LLHASAAALPPRNTLLQSLDDPGEWRPFRQAEVGILSLQWSTRERTRQWPWSDVFISSETSNLLLSTLSASVVGVGDALGQFDRTNLLRAVRADGVIVKPDDSITPLDSAYIAQTNNRGLPLLAAAQTRHEGSMTSYVFAFRQTDEHGT